MRSRLLIIFGCLVVSVARGQQGSASEGVENDLDHAVKVSDDALWHLELDGSAEVRTFRYTGLPQAKPVEIR